MWSASYQDERVFIHRIGLPDSQWWFCHMVASWLVGWEVNLCCSWLINHLIVAIDLSLTLFSVLWVSHCLCWSLISCSVSLLALEEHRQIRQTTKSKILMSVAALPMNKWRTLLFLCSSHFQELSSWTQLWCSYSYQTCSASDVSQLPQYRSGLVLKFQRLHLLNGIIRLRSLGTFVQSAVLYTHLSRKQADFF